MLSRLWCFIQTQFLRGHFPGPSSLADGEGENGLDRARDGSKQGTKHCLQWESCVDHVKAECWQSLASNIPLPRQLSPWSALRPAHGNKLRRYTPPHDSLSHGATHSARPADVSDDLDALSGMLTDGCATPLPLPSNKNVPSPAILHVDGSTRRYNTRTMSGH